MVSRTLTTEIENQHPLAIVRLAGFMAQLEVYQLKNQLDPLYKATVRFIIFDLEKLDFIDSAGIGVIAQARSECARLGGELVLTNPVTPQVVQALSYAGLGRVILIAEDVAAALVHLRSKHGLASPAQPAAPGAAEDVAALVGQIKTLMERLAAVEERLTRLERP